MSWPSHQHSGPSWHDIEIRERLVASQEDRRRLHQQLDDHEERIEDISHRVDEVRQELDTMLTWGKRLALLLALWAGAIFATINADDKADLVAMVLKRLLNKS